MLDVDVREVFGNYTHVIRDTTTRNQKSQRKLKCSEAQHQDNDQRKRNLREKLKGSQRKDQLRRRMKPQLRNPRMEKVKVQRRVACVAL